ncbi:MAG: ABC transporter ATP-binding protein/permease [Clostridia bacterium]|nr:ABC transporter ATP-binding protein/permease [Clostridia bacterium]
MLELKQIVKDYKTGDTVVRALDGVDLAFRRSEFVSILGPSGCGKTTLLNIVGGLDQYTAGDLVIDGVSTKRYRDADWDTYRNHSIGFVFQNYNLIPHQTVLANVELALTLSGVSKAERRRRAEEALRKVGLTKQFKKKPNQMSGGQMQRVAIARALVNDPEILLADEPTGALDTATSVQVMDLLKEISKDRLVIMVTHNPELAEKYSTRIVRLLDGRLVSDSAPMTEEELAAEREKTAAASPAGDKKTKKKAARRRSMSLATALSLSMQNLMTKKTRTFLTSFAGSIGIIGIALILSLSNGIQNYIDRVQEDTLSTYPIALNETTQDYSALMSAMVESGKETAEHRDSEGTIYVDDSLAQMMSAMYSTSTNDLKSFKAYIDSHMDELEPLISDIQYKYHFDMQIYSGDGKTRINPTTVFEHMDESFSSMISMMQNYSGAADFAGSFNIFSEMLDNDELLRAQYDVIAGDWATESDEVMLVIRDNNSISNMVAFILGLEDQETLADAMTTVMTGGEYHSAKSSYTYDDFLGMTFYVVPNDRFYVKTGRMYEKDGATYPVWEDVRLRDDYDQESFAKENGVPVHISGIIRKSEGAVATSITGTIAYRSSLGDMIRAQCAASELTKQQIATPDVDVFSGLPFETVVYTPDMAAEFVASLDDASRMMLRSYIAQQMGMDVSLVSDEMLVGVFASLDAATFDRMVSMFQKTTSATYAENVKKLGFVDEASPMTINLYAKDFASKDALQDFIDAYNDAADDAQKIHYVDMIGIFLSGVTTIIDVISYVLIAFVSISLVVSSIMIGIITYISVLERIKEIGILRAMGASKRDISRVFNAETLIVGFCAGAIGIVATIVLCLPINAIVHALSGVYSVNAVLPVLGGVLLVVLSMVLTFIAGLVPAKIAANKDPVVALRTE